MVDDMVFIHNNILNVTIPCKVVDNSAVIFLSSLGLMCTSVVAPIDAVDGSTVEMLVESDNVIMYFYIAVSMIK